MLEPSSRVVVTNLILPGNALSGGVLACSCWCARPTAMSPQGLLPLPLAALYLFKSGTALLHLQSRYDRLWAREGNQISNHGSSCARDIFQTACFGTTLSLRNGEYAARVYRKSSPA